MEFSTAQLDQIIIRRDTMEAAFKKQGVHRTHGTSTAAGFMMRIVGDKLEVMVMKGKGRNGIKEEGAEEWLWVLHAEIAARVTGAEILPGRRIQFPALGNEVTK